MILSAPSSGAPARPYCVKSRQGNASSRGLETTKVLFESAPRFRFLLSSGRDVDVVVFFGQL